MKHLIFKVVDMAPIKPTRKLDPVLKRLLLANLSALALSFAGCASTPESQQQLDQAIDLTTSALDIANTAAHIANAGGGGAVVPAPAARPAIAARSGGAAPTTDGYSQRGAFEECKKAYVLAGRADLVAECERRAQNMNSLTPPRR